MKNKILKFLLVGMMIFPVCFGLVACGSSKEKISKVNAKEVYFLSAVNSAQILVENSGTQRSLVNASNSTADQDYSLLNKYLNAFETSIINDNSFNQTVSKPTEEVDGEYAEYAVKISATLATVDGTNDEFILYYNEINSVTNEKIEDDETEINTTLEGVILINNDKFEVSGEKSVEIEGNEIETEIMFTTKNKNNPLDYVTVKQEVEEDEIEYTYSVYQNETLKSRTKIEYEFDAEDNENELTLQFMNIENESYSSVKYSIETQTENQTMYFNVKIKSNSAVTEKFKIYIEENQYRYVFGEDAESLYPRG